MSRAIVDLVDFACIMSRPTVEELNAVSGFKQSFGYAPNLVTDVFKNRRGRWVMVRIWSYWDAGTCRKFDLFLTTNNLKPVDNFSVIDFKNIESNNYEEILDLYNTEEIKPEAIEYYENNEEILDNFTHAFDDENDKKLRVKDKDFSDYL